MRYIISVFSLLITFAVLAQTNETATEGPQIKFLQSKHDFGEITQGEKVQHDFKYVNTGTAPLVISNVRTTCGCTAPNWSKEALAPGDTTNLKVVFSSVGKRGMQNKVITVYSNGINNPERVTLTGNVMMPAATEQ